MTKLTATIDHDELSEYLADGWTIVHTGAYGHTMQRPQRLKDLLTENNEVDTAHRVLLFLLTNGITTQEGLQEELLRLDEEFTNRGVDIDCDMQQTFSPTLTAYA